jgi:hypothetical protein
VQYFSVNRYRYWRIIIRNYNVADLAFQSDAYRVRVFGPDFPKWCGSMWIWISIGVKSQIRPVSASKSKSGSGNVSQ